MFDKVKCIEKIYALAKEKQIKIGDMEENAGVSKGYLSRVIKPDYAGSPSVEVLESIATQLNASLDYLVHYSADELSSSEVFMTKFIDKVMKKTIDSKLEWFVETSNILKAESADKVKNPLVSVEKDSIDGGYTWFDKHVYNSRFFDGIAVVSGSCYYAQIFQDTKLFLNRVFYGDGSVGKEALELYLYRNGEIESLCSSYYVAERIKNQMFSLYDVIESIPSKISLERTTRRTLQAFIDQND